MSENIKKILFSLFDTLEIEYYCSECVTKHVDADYQVLALACIDFLSANDLIDVAQERFAFTMQSEVTD